MRQHKPSLLVNIAHSPKISQTRISFGEIGRLRHKVKNANAINVIWAVQSSFEKYSVSRFTQISRISHAVPPH